ncbi:hypothetical protein WA588_000873 [Blastocystis sp. NMH]
METENISGPHRQGDFLRIPQVRPSSSLAYLIVNCVIPGLGTVISSWTDVEYHGWDWAVFITGILQFGLAWIIIGWAWSIWWGVRMFQDAQERKRKEEQALEGRAAPATEAESRSMNRPSTQSEEPLTVHVSQEAAE